MGLPPVVALEIGTSKVVALVAESRDEDGQVLITGIGEEASKGVRKGEILDLENAVACVQSALQGAEETGQVTIRQVLLAISGGHIESLVNRAAVPVLDDSGEITEEDVEQVMEMTRAVRLPADREILHTICQQFYIDDQAKVINPEGMEGSKLALDMLVLHGLRVRLNNTTRVVETLQLDVEDTVFGGICSALSVLSPEQRQAGAVLIDLGGGTTDYLAYSENVVTAAGSLGVGGDHITNDVAQAFTIPLSRAERLKKEAGQACEDDAADEECVTVPPDMGFPGRDVSLRSLNKVIHARTDETLGMVRDRLRNGSALRHAGAGVVLTGGGAYLKGVTAVAERVFGLPCSIGTPRNVSGLAKVVEGAEYATCCGLVQYGFKMQNEKRQSSLLGTLLRGLFGR